MKFEFSMEFRMFVLKMAFQVNWPIDQFTSSINCVLNHRIIKIYRVLYFKPKILQIFLPQSLNSSAFDVAKTSAQIALKTKNLYIFRYLSCKPNVNGQTMDIVWNSRVWSCCNCSIGTELMLCTVVLCRLRFLFVLGSSAQHKKRFQYKRLIHTTVRKMSHNVQFTVTTFVCVRLFVVHFSFICLQNAVPFYQAFC